MLVTPGSERPMFTQVALCACNFVLARFTCSMQCSDWVLFLKWQFPTGKFPQCIPGGNNGPLSTPVLW